LLGLEVTHLNEVGVWKKASDNSPWPYFQPVGLTVVVEHRPGGASHSREVVFQTQNCYDGHATECKESGLHFVGLPPHLFIH
jgi:hypothetical protein